ncbi:hypothetical protein BTUL_0201g00130 [Botrytis tulipae]|uniref:Uncharacterized protein n=1 Tax=Botrytis tulipae TaxID=87230 RepID=A0A4Z1EBK4_9HELO|nr:hypothetical protein BTUL_0201g00130 [Botrytis tulipae]
MLNGEYAAPNKNSVRLRYMTFVSLSLHARRSIRKSLPVSAPKNRKSQHLDVYKGSIASAPDQQQHDRLITQIRELAFEPRKATRCSSVLVVFSEIVEFREPEKNSWKSFFSEDWEYGDCVEQREEGGRISSRRRFSRVNRGKTGECREDKTKNAGQYTHGFNEIGTASSSKMFQEEEQNQGDSAK